MFGSKHYDDLVVFPLRPFFKEEMVQRHETEQRNHGSRVPWVLAENWVMIDDRKNPHGISRSGFGSCLNSSKLGIKLSNYLPECQHFL